jgi:hypothetical protein
VVTYLDVQQRLTMLGYPPTEADRSMLEFEMELIINYVVNYCNFNNSDDIPEILDVRIVDRICSEFLMKKKNSGQLEGFDYEQCVKTIREGDTQIHFGTENDGDTPESRFDKLVDYLQRGFDKWISQWRRITW